MRVDLNDVGRFDESAVMAARDDRGRVTDHALLPSRLLIDGATVRRQ